MPTITILHGNTSNGRLTLSPHEDNGAQRGAAVFWKIARHANVLDFRIEPKPNTTNIWLQQPAPHGVDTDWKGVVNPTARIGATYKYSIIWRSTEGGHPHTHDPKIFVIPALIDKDLAKPIALAALGLMALSAFLFLRARKRRHKLSD